VTGARARPATDRSSSTSGDRRVDRADPAILIPRGNLESRIEQASPDHAQPILLYCAAGNLGVRREVAGEPGTKVSRRRLHRLEAQRLPHRLPRTRRRSASATAAVLIPEVGGWAAEAARLTRLLLGTRRLGSPSAPTWPLRASGARDRRRRPSTPRASSQVMHSTARLGEWKAESASDAREPAPTWRSPIERLTSGS
jgi:hypothetical protein